jgi:diguanylate cyclase (GGDEF)-like protein
VSSPNARPSPQQQQIYRGLGERSVLSLERALGRSSHARRVGALNNAELVVWQSARRSLIAATLGFCAVLLRAVGFVHGPVRPLLAIVPLYIAVVALLSLGAQRRGTVSRLTLSALALTDVAAIFTTVLFVTPPAYYSRALLLSLLALQFARMFSGLSPSLTVVGGSIIAFPAMLYAASTNGYAVEWGEQAWTFVLFLIVGMNGMVLQASINRRLTKLVDLFSRAQRGDLSRTFVDEPDQEPDGITLLGRSYNHLRSELAAMVLTDTLTGCLNRRGFDRALKDTMRSGLRRHRDLSLLAIDVDHFKRINDGFGHPAGDAVLRIVAARLAKQCRSTDIVARYGGEEFAVLAPGAGPDRLARIAEAVRYSMTEPMPIGDGREVIVTVSIGTATVPTDAGSPEEVIRLADAALYAAKEGGRNRVVAATPETVFV